MPFLETRTSESAVDKAVVAIRSDATLPHLAALSDVELAYWCAGVQLAHEEQNVLALNQLFYELGKSAASHTIPLPEMFRALDLMLNRGRPNPSQMSKRCEASGHEEMLAWWNSARYYVIRGYQDRLR